MKEKKQDNLGLEDERLAKLADLFDLDALLKKKKARKVKKIIDKKCRLVDNKMEEIFTKGK